MKENLQAYASLAEIISSLAVLLTLVFLVIELRENTEVTRSAAFGNTTAQLNDFRLTVNSEELLTTIWQAYITEDIENLTRIERGRLNGIVVSLLSVYEDAFYSFDYGIMGEREWSRFDYRICQHYNRMQILDLNVAYNSLTPTFTEYMEAECVP